MRRAGSTCSLSAQIEKLSHAAELLVPRRQEILYGLIAQDHQLAIENFIKDSRCSFQVRVRAAVRLRWIPR